MAQSYGPAIPRLVTARLDAALEAGRITQAQRDEEVAELDDEIAHLGDFRDHGFHGRGPHDGDAPGNP